jgi:hypothetical protein
LAFFSGFPRSFAGSPTVLDNRRGCFLANPQPIPVLARHSAITNGSFPSAENFGNLGLLGVLRHAIH